MTDRRIELNVSVSIPQTGCMHRGVMYASGAEWSDPEDPCKTYKCIASVVTESTQKCYSQCDDNQLTPPRPGECCPTCQGKSLYHIYSTKQFQCPKCSTCQLVQPVKQSTSQTVCPNGHHSLKLAGQTAPETNAS